MQGNETIRKDIYRTIKQVNMCVTWNSDNKIFFSSKSCLRKGSIKSHLRGCHPRSAIYNTLANIKLQ